MPQRTLRESEFNAIRDRVLGDAPDGLDEASFTRWIGPRLAAAVGEAENLPPEPEGGAVGRFASNMGEMLNPVSAAKGLYDAVRHPLATASNIYEASANQGRQAIDMARQGRYVEAAGHAVGAVPLIGPAAAEAGQQIAEGDIAGGLGKTAGLLTPMAIGPALKAARAAIPARAATALEEGAASRIANVMRPEVGANKTRFGNIAERIAPDIAGNPEMSAWSREGLHTKVQQGLGAAESALDDAVNARLSARTFSTQSIIDDLLTKRARLMAEAVEGSQTGSRGIAGLTDSAGRAITPATKAIGRDVIPGPNTGRVAQIDKAISELKQLGPDARYESLRRIREAYDGPAKTVYNPSMTADFLVKKGESLGAADVTGSFRDFLAKADPQTATANAQYSLMKAADDVLTATAEVERTRPRVGRRIIARMTATAAGGASAGPAGAATGFILGPIVDGAMGSGFTTQLKTAQLMAKLAKAIRTGDEGQSASMLAQLRAMKVGSTGAASRTGAQGAAIQGREDVTSPSAAPWQPAGATR
jgi:hypothetical protein